MMNVPPPDRGRVARFHAIPDGAIAFSLHTPLAMPAVLWFDVPSCSTSGTFRITTARTGR